MNMKNKLIVVFLMMLLIFSVGIRFYKIPYGLFFGPEQGRDLLVVSNMLNHGKLTLIGPKTDIPGVFHGPIYYYILTLPFFLFQGNPVGIIFSLIIIQSLSLLLFFQVGKKLSSVYLGISASMLYAISPRSIDYARWLSNASLVPFFSLLTLFFLLKVIEKKNHYFYALALSAAILVHLELLNLVFLIFIIPLLIIHTKIKLSIKHALFSSILFVMCLSTFVVFDIRHQFIMSKNIFASVQSGGFKTSLSDSMRETTERFTEEVTKYVVPNVPMLASYIFLTGVFLIVARGEKKKVLFSPLFFWVGVPFFLLAFSRHSVLNHFFLFSSPAIFLIAALAIIQQKKYFTLLPIIIFCVVLLNNYFTVRSLKPWGITIGQEKSVIDFIYNTSKRQNFRYEAYTIPYFWNDAWQYMFQWYGKKTYAIEPTETDVKYVYFIWEREPTIYQKDWLDRQVEQYEKTDASAIFGEVHVERRESKKSH